MTTIILGASSSIWTQLTLPNPPAGSVPFVYTDNTTIAADPTNFNYDSSSAYLNLFGKNSLIDITLISCKQGKAKVVPVTGFTYSFPAVVPPTGTVVAKNAMVDTVIFLPAGVLATGTVNACANPVDGQDMRVLTTQNITLLTVLPGAGQTLLGGAAALLSANSSIAWIYDLGSNTWYKK